jgi:hypothetical protein
MAPKDVDAFGRHGNANPFGERRTLTSRARTFLANLGRRGPGRVTILLVLLLLAGFVLALVTGEGGSGGGGG